MVWPGAHRLCRYLILSVNFILKFLTDSASVLGDFRQCLPVVPKGSRAQIIASTIAYAPFWKDVKVMPLKVNMRVLAQAPNMSPDELKHATEFAEWQLKVGEGTANDDHCGILITLPPGITVEIFCSC
jgi:hypothetical protein